MPFFKNKFSYGQYLQIREKIWKIYLCRNNTFIQVDCCTITMISSSKSICVSGAIFCSMQNDFTCPITLSI